MRRSLTPVASKNALAVAAGTGLIKTGSACRTFNFLMSDRRRVAAALLMIEP